MGTIANLEITEVEGTPAIVGTETTIDGRNVSVLEWLNWNEYREIWELEKTDSHITANYDGDLECDAVWDLLDEFLDKKAASINC